MFAFFRNVLVSILFYLCIYSFIYIYYILYRYISSLFVLCRHIDFFITYCTPSCILSILFFLFIYVSVIAFIVFFRVFGRFFLNIICCRFPLCPSFLFLCFSLDYSLYLSTNLVLFSCLLPVFILDSIF